MILSKCDKLQEINKFIFMWSTGDWQSLCVYNNAVCYSCMRISTNQDESSPQTYVGIIIPCSFILEEMVTDEELKIVKFKSACSQEGIKDSDADQACKQPEVSEQEECGWTSYCSDKISYFSFSQFCDRNRNGVCALHF